MKRMMSRKSHSWWWDSHISPKNSKWLAENLEEMDKRVKSMLKLIEEEGDSFAKKAEMYYQRRPQLISHVEDFYRMYRALAERYDQVTGELRKNIPSELQTQGSGSGSDFSLEPPSPSLLSPECTPESKPSRPKPSPRAAGFDFFLGSGGSSDLFRKGSEGSSSSDSSDSGSDSEDTKEVSGQDLSEGFNQRIAELKNELCDARDKLREYQEKISNRECEHLEDSIHSECSSRISALEEELAVAQKRLRVSEGLIATLRQKLVEGSHSLESENMELDQERKQVLEMEEHIAALEAEIADHKRIVVELNNALVTTTKKFEAELASRDHAVEGYKAELSSASESFLQEKSCLQSDVSNLESIIKDLDADVKMISEQKLVLEACVSKQDNTFKELKAEAANDAERFLQEKTALKAEILGLSESNAALEVKLKTLEGEINRLKAEKSDVCTERGKHIEELKKSIYELNLKVEIITSDNEKLNALASALTSEVKFRDERISELDLHLHELHLEHVKLIKEFEKVQRASADLQQRVKELEEEVDRQKVAILDSAEGKREAIRQLCFSLEHYRVGYKQLWQVLQGHKRPAVMAA